MPRVWTRMASVIALRFQRDGPSDSWRAGRRPAASIAARSDPNRAATVVALGHRPGAVRYRAAASCSGGAWAGDQSARAGGESVSCAQSRIASNTRCSLQLRRRSGAGTATFRRALWASAAARRSPAAGARALVLV